jgi:hypothetical protein
LKGVRVLFNIHMQRSWAGGMSSGCVGLEQKSGRARAEDAASGPVRPSCRVGPWHEPGRSSAGFFEAVPVAAHRA